MTARDRMLADLLVLLSFFPELVRAALAELDDDEQLAILEQLLPDAEAALAMLDGPDGPATPFQPVANLCGRLRDLVDLSPATAAKLGQCERIFRRCRDADAHGLLFSSK
jgi:hypothetical protein